MNALPHAVLAGVLLFLNGCATTSAPDGAQTITLPRGSTGQAVRDALGPPVAIESVKGNPAAALWTYRRPVTRRIKTIEASVENVLVFDPSNIRTGMGTAKEAVQQMQEIVIEEVLVLIMENDRLTEWHRHYRETATGPVVR